ncbi:cbb3-type cytochrome oxidase assembly protein CcoS [Rufibacter glacialis]|uniref:Cbb3-type cytochrome oxidase maturation protein n=2 Tax=Rufibacter TaxID=1379908 RepID=A0A839GW71_9BACT|nr:MULTISPECIES: cbb3-type cytochrome oxidase assembly protein CcoS [Rufibacter]KAA6437811.1 cbb3-type cytochrome oxidase assembly protein CcoS [Rufibacter glacialis]MBA9078986.1 cbb3-type cytochrome oxidase maturation protein [Rufibacter quisquiliarum]GGK56068.1 cytochrome oxidase maturation protein Cbb3 [Rufibacter glacialis]
MNIIFLLICISLLVAILFLGAFLWAVRSGQYEDDYTPSVRILFDNELTKKQPITSISTKPMEDTAHVS